MESTEADTGLPRSMGAPAIRALAVAGYTELSQLVGASEEELKALHGVGPKALRVLRDALGARGLSLS